MKKSVIFKTMGIMIVLMWLVYVVYYNQQLQIRFNMHALGRYLHAYKLVEKKEVGSFTDLPNFHLVSHSAGLEVDSEDFKSRASHGYFYDFKRLNQKQFVISASPLIPHFYLSEFGMLEDGNLRVNHTQVDPEPDSYDEVKEWPILPEDWFDLTTKQESS